MLGPNKRRLAPQNHVETLVSDAETLIVNSRALTARGVEAAALREADGHLAAGASNWL